MRLLLIACCLFTSLSAEAAPAMIAIAHLQPTADSTVRGTVRFTVVAGGLQITARVEGLTPGQHGFHIHQFGDCCSDPKGQCAGGHWDPQGTGQHGTPEQPLSARHAGDLGNLEAAADGTATYDRVVPGLTLTGDLGVIGHGIVVHANPDDFSQPTGNAGARLAVGGIVYGQPPAP